MSDGRGKVLAVDFEIVGHLREVEPIAVSKGIQFARLRKLYGPGRWRKLKGVATVQRLLPT